MNLDTFDENNNRKRTLPNLISFIWTVSKASLKLKENLII